MAEEEEGEGEDGPMMGTCQVQPQFLYSRTAEPWVSLLTALSPSFHFIKVGEIIPTATYFAGF